MIFTEEHVQQIKDGKKTQTRRPTSLKFRSPWWCETCSYEAGDTIAVQPGRGKDAEFYIRLTEDPRREYLGEITDEDAKAEGTLNREAYVLIWEEIHGEDSWKPWSQVWVLTFEVVAADD